MNRCSVLILCLLFLTGCREGSPLSTAFTTYFETPEVLPSPTPSRVVVIDPLIALEPTASYAGSYVAVEGRQWPPGEIVVVVLEDANGRSAVLAAGTTGSDGLFSTGFLYPANQRWLQGDRHTLVAYTPTGSLLASALLSVEPPEEVAANRTAIPGTVTVTTPITTPITTPTTETEGLTVTAPVSVTPAVTVASSASDTVPVTATEVTAAERPTSTVDSTADRDAVDQILFRAEPASPVTLDGNLDLWPNGWIPIQNVVWGADQYDGDEDLSADFQLLWSLDGLYIAVRVRDEQFRSGPPGTDMWQGDGFEIHFDRLLAEDFIDPVANGDDYQLGISFGPGLSEIRAYRWLPAFQEGPVSVPGTVISTVDGYQAELLLPWILLDVGPQDVFAEAVFGFNLSVNDNDGEVPAQQTILSASPNRTDHETPTEWGTLRLSAQ